MKKSMKALIKMKKLIALALVICTALSMTACGEKGSDEPSESEIDETLVLAKTQPKTQQSDAQGNASAFSMSDEQVKTSLAGTWVNQNDYTEKIRFGEDLTFTLFLGGNNSEGTASVDTGSGILSVKYSDGARDDKNYVWVDSRDNLSANTWYIDGGTFALGNTIYIRDLEI